MHWGANGAQDMTAIVDLHQIDGVFVVELVDLTLVGTRQRLPAALLDINLMALPVHFFKLFGECVPVPAIHEINHG
jgi:hypothetical protein